MTTPTRRPGASATTAALIVRRARQLGGLTQQELAQRMSVPQSTISAYERGVRVPSVTTLERMIDAAGLRLTWGLTHGGSGGGAMATLSGPIGRRLVERLDEVMTELTERGFTGSRVVGPVATGTEQPHEHLVIVVDETQQSLAQVLAANGMLGLLLGCPVTVMPVSDLDRYGWGEEDLAAAVVLTSPS